MSINPIKFFKLGNTEYTLYIYTPVSLSVISVGTYLTSRDFRQDDSPTKKNGEISFEPLKYSHTFNWSPIQILSALDVAQYW